MRTIYIRVPSVSHAIISKSIHKSNHDTWHKIHQVQEKSVATSRLSRCVFFTILTFPNSTKCVQKEDQLSYHSLHDHLDVNQSFLDFLSLNQKERVEQTTSTAV